MEQKGFSAVAVVIVLALVSLVIFRLPKAPKPDLTTPRANIQATVTQHTSNAETQAKLEKYLTVEAALLGVSENMSLFFKDLKYGSEISIEPSKSWIPASTIKAYVALEAFRQRDLGLIDFDRTVTIQGSNVVPTELETLEFPRLREGTAVTIRQLVEAMIVQSDNTAYNTLLDILDRRNINLALRNIGLTETVVGEKLNLDDSQFQQDLQVSGRQPNITTVKDLASFFNLLYNKKLADSTELLDVFKRQKINNMIPALLPKGIDIAHKTGDWTPIFHDGGIVFKPDDPFILAVFTSDGDPKIVAKFAQVAYFQNADVVGKQTSYNFDVLPKNIAALQKNYPEITLDENSSKVLAEETNIEKFPTITAADLGIKPADLNTVPQQAEDLPSAWVTPGSLLYRVKIFFEDKLLQSATSNSSKSKVYLTLSKDRLMEVKTLLENNNLSGVDSLLKESEEDLAKATELAKNDPDKDLLLVSIKQVNDLHFAVLNEKAQKVPDNQKEQFINLVYNFYQKNHKEVVPIVSTSVIANPIQQKPAIGIISGISNNIATIKFDDGSTKQMILTDETKVRAFQQTNYQGKGSLSNGDKIAVIGLTTSGQQIIPQFVLKNVPKELPSKHQGTVIEINPGDNTLKILDQKGLEETIKIDLQTSIKSKDTDVSLTGIKAGSQITVFGTTENKPIQSQNNSSSTPTFNFSPSSAAIPQAGNPQSNNQIPPGIGQPSGGVTQKNISVPGRQPKNNTEVQKQTELKATSVTVTVNSSGKNEVKQSSSENKPQPTNQGTAKKEPNKQENKK